MVHSVPLTCASLVVTLPSLCARVGNMLFSVETQTTEERTQQYQSEVESIYKDLTAKGKALMLSTELGVRSLSQVSRYLQSFSPLAFPWTHFDQRPL